ncbi:MAG TPA: ATP-binding protein [Gammaproteobacteria bacterium]|nr:ATP-binding protein [Gammaproteobacteria bacterium]
MKQNNKRRTQGLEDAFHVFNQVSEQLTASYQILEARVAELTEELNAARNERLLQLAEKERLANNLQRLLSALPAGVLVLDGTGVICEYNPTALDLLGEPLQGVRWMEVAERAFAPLGDGQLVLRDGRRVVISTSSLGSEPGQILLIKDVTETHALQERLNRHQRLSAMGEMAASLAHQIRTPLASALLYASHLANPQQQTVDYRTYAEKIVPRLRHLEKLVDDMLLFAKGGSFGADEIRVADLLLDFRQALETTLFVSGCQLTITDETPHAILRGNRDALLSMLMNIAGNAIQACGKGGQLELATQMVSDEGGAEAIKLTLTDNGPGIPQALLERIFEPFFTTRPQGTGLGLAVVQAIARAHQGSVWVESQQGRGSTFGLRFPLKGQADALPSGTAALSNAAPLTAGKANNTNRRVA